MAQTDILEYIRKTPHNSNVNVVKGMLNAEGGGGGDSDLSTATVTYDNQAGARFYLSTADEGDGMSIPAIDASQGTAKAILYKGKAFGAIVGPDGITVTVTGSAEYEEPALIITGDCTITIA